MTIPEQEQWKSIPGYEGLYSISDHGRVRTHPRERGYPKKIPPGGILAQHPLPAGYLQVGLSLGGRSAKKYVHQLVLMAFVGPRPSPRHHACHNDGDKSNNTLSNLRWDTVEENAADKVRHGTAYHLRITHCPRGHEYTPENTRLNATNGGRYCSTCNHNRNREAYVYAEPRIPYEPLPGEEWRPVVGYENTYAVSNLGRVMSDARGVRQIRQPKVDAVKGFRHLTLHDGGHKKQVALHRLVAEAFCVRPDGCNFVRHLDGDLGNNRADNLVWTAGYSKRKAA